MQPNSSCIHVILVEDDVHFQDTIRSAIAMTSDMQLRFVADTKQRALQALDGAPADVVVVDLGLPDGSGIDVIRAARRAWHDCAILVSTTFGDELHVIQSIEAGANGYLLKDSASKTLSEEIRCVHGGGSPISPLIARHVLRRFQQGGELESKTQTSQHSKSISSPTPAASLSTRERQVLDLITKGFSYEEIANLMQISRYTVMTFVRRIYAKLEVNSKTEAIYEARLQGLLPP